MKRGRIFIYHALHKTIEPFKKIIYQDGRDQLLACIDYAKTDSLFDRLQIKGDIATYKKQFQIELLRQSQRYRVGGVEVRCTYRVTCIDD